MSLVLFYVWEDARKYGFIKILPDIYILRGLFVQSVEYLILDFVLNSFQGVLLANMT